ncbi:hypothetical protein D3C72_1338630 [compost metagenome]
MRFFCRPRTRRQYAGFQRLQRGAKQRLLARLHALAEQLDAFRIRFRCEPDLAEQLAHAAAIWQDEFLRTGVFAFHADGDSSRPFVGREFDLVTIPQVDLIALRNWEILDVSDRSGIAHHTDVGGFGQRLGQADDLVETGLVTHELESLRVFCQSADLHGLLARLDKNDVAVVELPGSQVAFQQEVIQVHDFQSLVATLDRDIQERSAIRIDTAGLVEIAQDAVTRRAVVHAGPANGAGHIHAHRLGCQQAGVDRHLAGKDPAQRIADCRL